MVQRVYQTDDEQMAMYMKLPKHQIVAMLIQANKVIDGRAPVVSLQESKICNCGKSFGCDDNPICDGFCDGNEGR